MLFRTKDLEAIMSGRVTTAFRRWKKVGAKAGGQQRTQLGMVAIDSVEEIDPATLTEADAKAANYPDLAALHAMFDAQEGTCYRITPPPRRPRSARSPANAADISDDDRAKIDKRLAKLDAEAPWTSRPSTASATTRRSSRQSSPKSSAASASPSRTTSASSRRSASPKASRSAIGCRRAARPTSRLGG